MPQRLTDPIWFQRSPLDRRRVVLTPRASRALAGNVITAAQRERFIQEYRHFVSRKA